MPLRILSSGVVALGVALLMASTALAQPPRNRNPGMRGMQSIKKEGTLISASQLPIQMSTSGNEKIYVMAGPDTEINIKGTAEPDYLKSGVAIEFVADVAKDRTVKDKIIKLTVVSLTNDRPAGLYPADSSIPDKKDEKDGDEKAKPLALDPGIGDAPPAKGHNKKKDPDSLSGDLPASKPGKGLNSSPKPPGTFAVRGTIKMCKDGKITVAAGRGSTIKADFAGDATIDVKMADLHLARPDDRITVSGQVNPARPGMMMAESITIELANPLTGAKKHATRPERPAKTPAKVKKGDASADPDNLLGK